MSLSNFQYSLPFDVISVREIQVLARGLMDRHGLRDWRFEFDQARSRLGSCHYTRKTISLSKYIARQSEEVIRETVLHEIAHALVGKRADHGARWKAKAVELGCDPKSRADISMVERPKRVIACRKCGKVETTLYRFRLARWLKRWQCEPCRSGVKSFDVVNQSA